MTQISKILDSKFKITMTNVPKYLIENTDIRPDRRDFSRN